MGCQAAVRELTRAMFDRAGNLPPLPGIFPDKMAPIVRNGARELVMARWGMPSPPQFVTGIDRPLDVRVAFLARRTMEQT